MFLRVHHELYLHIDFVFAKQSDKMHIWPEFRRCGKFKMLNGSEIDSKISMKHTTHTDTAMALENLEEIVEESFWLKSKQNEMEKSKKKTERQTFATVRFQNILRVEWICQVRAKATKKGM